MPQGRRKTPFSGKAKKEQLQAKKHKQFSNEPGLKKTLLTQQLQGFGDPSSSVQQINYQPGGRSNTRSNPNRYILQFYKESNADIKANKELAMQSLHTVSQKELEINLDDYFLEELNFPKRPPWSFNMNREQLDAKENKYFMEYVENIKKNIEWKDLSYFELNLETWRQLWRVLEMSDVILIIVDIRFSALMFPPSLYEYVTKTLKKDMILVLNKIDLAPSSLVAAWKNYFKQLYPELHIIMFTSFPSYNLIGKQSDKAGLNVRKQRGRMRMAAEGTQMLFDICREIVANNVDLSSWQKKIKEEMTEEYDEENLEVSETVHLTAVDTGYFEHEKYKNGILTIGCVGQPNVGKSSLLNGIMGKKVVSVSKTPGHTKHFQTIFLTPNVRLCDCPGLVFPSKVPKVLQVLMGSFPIAQLREPFTPIKYLAERLNLPQLLRIGHPEGDDTWSAMDVCDGWAKKRGFLTAKAARLDSHRAANNLLRMALDGKICLCLRPPKYTQQKHEWENHPDNEKVKWIQAKSSDEKTTEAVLFEYPSDDECSSAGDHVNSESEEDSAEEVPLIINKFAALNTEN